MRSACAWSVIVPSYRSSGTIDACLASLALQDHAEPYEVIVVDSTPDATAERVRRAFPAVQVVHLPERADPARARNAGARLASAPRLAFLDSDCTAPASWLRCLSAVLDDGYDGAGGAIDNANGESAVSWAGYLAEFREFMPGGPARDVENLTLGNAAYRREVFWAPGGLPVGYFPQEDQVFHAALRQRGARLRLDPSIVVPHVHRSDRARFLAHQRRIGRANARVLQCVRRPGRALARHPRLAGAGRPALVSLRFARTVAAWRRLAPPRPAPDGELVGLCWLGAVAWGRGFVEGARGRAP